MLEVINGVFWVFSSKKIKGLWAEVGISLGLWKKGSLNVQPCKLDFR